MWHTRPLTSSLKVVRARCGSILPSTDGVITFTAESDALITRGIVALLVRVFSGRTPDEIIGADIYFIDRIGLRQNLSPTRSNGLLSMMKQMRLYALAYKSKQEQS